MNVKSRKRTMIRRILAVILTLLLCQIVPVLPLSAAVTKGDPSGIMGSYPELDMVRYGTATGSGFELWGGHFQFDVQSPKSSFDATPKAGTAANNWFFDLYYRPFGTTGDYDTVTCDMKGSACQYDFGDSVIYRLILNDNGFERLQKTEYEMIVVVREGSTVKGWKKLSFNWNDATDDAFSEFCGEWPDYTMVGFKVPMNDTVTKYHLKEGDIPNFEGSTFRPGYIFLGWEADGVVYKELPPVTKEVTYTAAYRSNNAGDLNKDGDINVKDASRLLQWLASADSSVTTDLADIDGNRIVTIADATALLGLVAEGAKVVVDPTFAALQGKTALFCGDSITMAKERDADHPYWGWAGRIGTFYNMNNYVNQGYDGAVVSTNTGNRVITQLHANAGKSFDYVILHGATNDAWQNVAVGTMTDADCFDKAKFNTATFAGGLEELFYTAKTQFPDAKIGYIINFRFNPSRTAPGDGRIGDMTEYVEVSKQICDKWGVPYLDLFSDDALYNTLLPNISTRYIIDGVHPNSAGYDVLYPYIADFMASMK